MAQILVLVVRSAIEFEDDLLRLDLYVSDDQPVAGLRADAVSLQQLLVVHPFRLQLAVRVQHQPVRIQRQRTACETLLRSEGHDQLTMSTGRKLPLLKLDLSCLKGRELLTGARFGR